MAASHLGLTTHEAHERLRDAGPNEIVRAEGTPAWRALLRQFHSPLVLLLVAAAVLSAFLAETQNAIAIAVIVSLNAGIGFYQESRAERAVFALRSLTARHARVVRDGHLAEIPAAEVVVGDLLALEPGDVVAADAALVEANDLTLNEAPLTGESLPVRKRAQPAADDAPLAERHDRVFLGTSVATGTGFATVSAIGMATEMGRIAGLLVEAMPPTTPLQDRLLTLGRILVYVCVGLVVVVAAIGVVRGIAWLDVLMGAVALAVAAVPEGLPAVVTIALAVGVRRMTSRNVLIRRLSSVETLGAATVICTDKTGTLTTGVMEVREVRAPDEHAILLAAASCCDAELDQNGGATGDPTEVALLRSAREHGIDRERIEREHPRITVEPFEPSRRRMSIVRSDGVRYTKGALEVLVPLCSEGTAGALEANAELAARGLRVLAIATGLGGREDGLRLLGLVGMADAPRPEAIEAVASARAAGIRVVMITGDHPITANAIASELGLVGPTDRADEVVFARATAEDKSRIVRELANRGEVVAMTGDGVNDAPSVREAHIGIAMGRTATEVTREASDMVLTDDNLSSIVEAVRQGRVIYGNIRKTVVYLLSGNGAELMMMLAAAIIGLPLPLVPLQLLWLNLMCEPLPGVALAVDPPDDDVLRAKPRSPTEPLLGRSQWTEVAVVASIQTAVALAVFLWALDHRSLPAARSLAFSTLVFGILLRSFAARSPDRLLWEVGAFTNLKLLAVVVLSIALHVTIHLVPVTHELFGLGGVSLVDLALPLALGFIPVTLVEIAKLVRRFAFGRLATVVDP